MKENHSNWHKRYLFNCENAMQWTGVLMPFVSHLSFHFVEENNHPDLSQYTANHCGIDYCRILWILIKPPSDDALLMGDR